MRPASSSEVYGSFYLVVLNNNPQEWRLFQKGAAWKRTPAAENVTNIPSFVSVCPAPPDDDLSCFREDRRTKQMESRKQKKENLLGARRGLVMT